MAPSDGSGVFSLDSGYLAVTGQTITISQHNPVLEDIRDGLTARLMRSGVAPMTGPLKLADGTAGAPSLSFSNAATQGFYKTTSGIGVSIGGTKVGEWLSTGLELSSIGIIAGTSFSDLALTDTLPAYDVSATANKRILVSDVLKITNLLTADATPDQTADYVMTYDTSATAAKKVLLQNLAGRTFPVPAVFKNLSIKVASNTTVTVAADFVTTTDGTAYQTTALSGTINLGTNGAANALDTSTIAIDTWYAIWAIAKADGTTAGLASTSFTSPTLPTGYTFKARIGAVQTIHGSATLYGTWQLGRRAQYVVGLAQTTNIPIITSGTVGTYSTTSPTLSAVTVVGNGSFVPTTAGEIFIAGHSAWKAGTSSSLIVAPNTSWGGSNNGPSGSAGNVYPLWLQSGNAAQSIQATMLLEATTIAFASSNTGAALACLGWTDNI